MLSSLVHQTVLGVLTFTICPKNCDFFMYKKNKKVTPNVAYFTKALGKLTTINMRQPTVLVPF